MFLCEQTVMDNTLEHMECTSLYQTLQVKWTLFRHAHQVHLLLPFVLALHYTLIFKSNLKHYPLIWF